MTHAVYGMPVEVKDLDADRLGQMFAATLRMHVEEFKTEGTVFISIQIKDEETER